MSPFARWLVAALHDGIADLDGPPDPSPADALDILAAAHARHALDVAGPRLPFDASPALFAARWLAAACWQLVAHDNHDHIASLGTLEPRSPAAHLSADLCLRLLPTVHRRASLRGPDDPLAAACENLLRRCPLSGVLARLTAAPLGDTTFSGHAGLQLLYADRLTRHPHPAWLPPAGPARERAALAFAERRLPVPVSPELPA